MGLGKRQTVLDYGCGPGAFAIPAARIVGRDGKVYALDIDAEALSALRRKADSEGLGNVKAVLVNKSAAAVSLIGEKSDVALLYDVLQLVEDKRSLLRGLHKALKPGGFLSVFPMHIGAERTLEIVGQDGLFRLRDRRGMLLNFTASPARGP